MQRLLMLPLLIASACFNSSSILIISSKDYLGIGTGEGCVVETGIEQGIATAKKMSEAYLILIGSEFEIKGKTNVGTKVEIWGSGQVVRMAAAITIEANGSLQVSNVTFKPSAPTPLSTSLFPISGSALFFHCHFSSFSSLIISLTGFLEFHSCYFTLNFKTAIIISGQDSAIVLRGVEISAHTGNFLTILSAAGSAAGVRVDVGKCRFRDNLGITGEVLISVGGKSEEKVARKVIDFDESSFENNSIALMDFSTSGITASFQDCLFRGNYGKGLKIDVKSSDLYMKNCTWTGNFHQIIEIHSLSGSFILDSVLISDQLGHGFILIRNSAPANECFFTIHNSQIFDTALYVNESSPGLLSSYSCMVTISDTAIRNVKVFSQSYTQVKSLLFSEFGSMTLRSCSITDSGSSGVLVLALYSPVLLQHSLFTNPIAGQRVFLTIAMSLLTVSNLTITKGAYGNVSKTLLGFDSFMYIAANLADVKIDGLVIPSQSVTKSVAIFAASFSRFDVSNVVLRNLSTKVVIEVLQSRGTFSNLSVENSVISDFLVQTASNSYVNFTKISISNVTATEKFGGIAYAGMMSTIQIVDFRADNSSGKALIQGKNSTFSMENATVFGCEFRYLVANPLNCAINLRNFQIFGLKGGIIYAVRSRISLINGFIGAIFASENLFSSFSSEITMSNLTIDSVFGQQSIGSIADRSKMTIFDSNFSNLWSKWGDGFKTDLSVIEIARSSFQQFNISLFQAKQTSFSIKNSQFKDGFSSITSEKSNLAYGGVLGCQNCPIIELSSISVFNVSARIGGFVSSQCKEMCDFHVENSQFVGCSAKIGGVFYVSGGNVSISTSVFSNNKAEATGGAVFAISTSAVIRNCEFTQNSANEGGAVRWKLYPIHFDNVSFSSNSAIYGPNIASFGVHLWSKPLANVPSGQPFDLIFELRDQYGQRVVTATDATVRLVPEGGVRILGEEATVASNGLFTFYGLTVFAKPGSREVLKMIGERIEDSTVNETVSLTFRNCSPGEIEKTDRCEYCFAGNVSFAPSDTHCTFCPENAFCPGGSRLTVNRNYWRPGWNSTKVMLCPLAGVCLGGMNNSCADGFTGKLCNECSEGWYRFRFVECRECPGWEWMWVGPGAAVGIVILFGYAVLRFAVHKPDPFQLFTLHLILTHLHFLSSLSPLKVSYPSLIKNSLHAFSYLSSLSIPDLPAGCFSLPHPEYSKSLISMCILPVCSLLFLILSRILSKDHWKRSALLLTCSFLPISTTIVVQVSVPLLACQQVDTEAKWLFTDMSQTCWQDTHRQMVLFLVVPGLAVNVVAPILAVLGTIASNKELISKAYLPFWTSGYRWPAWSGVITGMKITSIWLATNAITYSKLMQVTAILGVIIVVCVLNVFFRRLIFETTSAFLMTQLSLLIVAVSTYICSFYIFNEPGNLTFDYCVGLVFLLLNLGFLTRCGYCLVCDRRREMHAVASQGEASNLSQAQIMIVPQNSIVDESSNN